MSRFSFGNIIGDPFALSTLSISVVRSSLSPRSFFDSRDRAERKTDTYLEDHHILTFTSFNLARLVDCFHCIYHRRCWDGLPHVRLVRDCIYVMLYRRDFLRAWF